jgi:ADP-L-glycero-D-manno-heptose 6-epimerase
LLTDKNPLNAYARSKLEFENQMNSFAKESQAKVIGLRYTNVYGPGELHKGKRASMITQIIQKIKLGENPKLFKSGEQTRDWVFVKDVVNANLQAADADIRGIFNIGSGESMSFNRILDLINQELKSNYFAEYIECPYSDFYQTKTLANISQAEKKLGYKPEKNMEISVKSYIREIFLKKLEKCT